MLAHAWPPPLPQGFRAAHAHVPDSHPASAVPGLQRVGSPCAAGTPRLRQVALPLLARAAPRQP